MAYRGYEKKDRTPVPGENRGLALIIRETKVIQDMYQPCNQDEENQQFDTTLTTPIKRFGINKENPRRKLF